MKKSIIILILALVTSISINAQGDPTIRYAAGTHPNQNRGVQLPNIERVKAKDLKKLRIPTVSITETLKNAKALSSWVITPAKPRYSSLSIDSYYGEYSLQGWKLEPRPLFEGPDFSGFYLSAIRLNFRVSKGFRYLIRVKLQKTNNNWYAGKTILATAINNTFAKYPIDSYNNEVLIPFTANSSGNKSISIGNIITTNNRLFGYTVEKISIDKIQL